MKQTYKLAVSLDGYKIEDEIEINTDDFKDKAAIKDFLEEELRDFRIGHVDSWYEEIK